jgi:hypothetical protein
MVQLNGLAASRQLTFAALKRVAEMERAGICRDNRSTCSTLLLSDKDGFCRCVHPHVIADHEVRSHGIHVDTDLLFFFSCQKNIPQLMHQHETLLQGPAVQCLLHCAVRE